MADALIYTAIQQAAIDSPAELARLASLREHCGAEAQFIGRVRRDPSPQPGATALSTLFLEHYPGMTERSLQELAQYCAARFELSGMIMVHRVGLLLPGADIVLVAAASPHRKNALHAVDCAMDQLKSTLPIWKREHFGTACRWVEARSSDAAALTTWQEPSSN